MEHTDIVIRYSGGAANADPEASLGGVISTSDGPADQGFTALSNITGVTIQEVSGMNDGDCLVTFGADVIQMRPPESYYGPAMDLQGLGDRNYVLLGSEGLSKGYMVISVVEASLPSTNEEDTVAITTTGNEIFDDVELAEAANGAIQYRCLYIKNTHATEDLVRVGVYIPRDTPGVDTLAVAIDTDAGVGDGVTTGVAATVINEDDPSNLISGLSFTETSDVESAVEEALTITPGDSVPIWIRRTIPAGVSLDELDNAFSIGLKLYIGA